MSDERDASGAAADDQAALDAFAYELEQAAERLRSDTLDQEQAAALVERLAELAARLAGELERQARAPIPGGSPGQESLL